MSTERVAGQKKRFCRAILLVAAISLSCLLWYALVEVSVARAAARNGRCVIGSIELSRARNLAPSEMRLAIDIIESGKDRLSIVSLQEKHRRTVKTLPDASFPAWSPSGEQLAFSKQTTRELAPGIHGGSIGLYSWKRGSVTTLPDKYFDRDPIWRQDGKAIAFARLDYGNASNGWTLGSWLMTVSVQGDTFGIPQRISSRQIDLTPEALEWRPLHNQIAYVGVGKLRLTDDAVTRSNDIYLLDIAEKTAVKLTQSGDVARYSLACSPDGKIRCVCNWHRAISNSGDIGDQNWKAEDSFSGLRPGAGATAEHRKYRLVSRPQVDRLRCFSP